MTFFAQRFKIFRTNFGRSITPPPTPIATSCSNRCATATHSTTFKSTSVSLCTVKSVRGNTTLWQPEVRPSCRNQITPILSIALGVKTFCSFLTIQNLSVFLQQIIRRLSMISRRSDICIQAWKQISNMEILESISVESQVCGGYWEKMYKNARTVWSAAVSEDVLSETQWKLTFQTFFQQVHSHSCSAKQWKPCLRIW